ncbi:MAG TPA: NAD(P)-binding domain-containing protein, partial [Acidimicrobiales bacterium]|nr:NAD(P)-binding domain-containing protein [Acidimicrobiales bacterium]
MTSIAIIGTGYVGLTSGACFARLGHDVACVDVDADKVARLSAGDVPIVEEGLDALVAEGLGSGRLRFTTDVAEGVADRAVVFLCVPTPHSPDGSVDLSYVEAAASSLGPLLTPGAVVVNKSTVPVGTTRVVKRLLDRDDVTVA